MHVIDSPWFVSAKTIALYSAIREEADPHEIAVSAAALGKNLVYPRVGADQLYFVRADPHELTTYGPYGILEPPKDRAPWIKTAIDLFIVPGLAFTRRGDRIGYGKGYYDRALQTWRAEYCVAIGFGFEMQILDEIPTDSHDVRLDALATENGLTVCGPRAL
jgi:5-formyltetrahydrofolate cyclo-ligase